VAAAALLLHFPLLLLLGIAATIDVWSCVTG